MVTSKIFISTLYFSIFISILQPCKAQTNIALNKEATQSNTFSIYDARLAVDGDEDTCSVAGVGSHADSIAWWMVDLGGTFCIKDIHLLNTHNYYESLYMSDFELQVSNTTPIFTTVTSHPHTVPPSTWFHASLSHPICARYVRLLRIKGFRQDAISICDVRIYDDDDVITTLTTESSFESSSNQVHTTLTNHIGSSSTNQNDFYTTNHTHPSSSLDSISVTTPPIKTCMEGYWRCGDGGRCVREEWRCDLEDDCADGSDEWGCDCTGDNHFKCTNGKCIEKDWFCDNHDDCGDASDEGDCVRACHANEFRCSDGKCVWLKERCDGVVHCEDGSDEVLCEKCAPNQFQCNDSSCVMNFELCDGVTHCADLSDEVNCDCERGYRCEVNKLCVFDWMICNHIRDCPDASDEVNCTCRTYERECRGGACIHEEWWCDGVEDCRHGDDEQHCHGCEVGEFRCGRGECVVGRCDGVVQCADQSDELDCVDSSSDVITLTYKEVKGYEICADGWMPEWSNKLCAYMGMGPPQSTLAGPVSGASFALLKSQHNNNSTSFLANFYFEGTCVSRQGIRLVCSSRKCGHRSPSLDPHRPYLVNGDLAQRGAWPWMVQMVVRGKVLCGGVIVEQGWILTAAHCLYSRSAEEVHVKAGKINLRGYEEGYEQGSKTSQIFIHPKYNDVTVVNDFALIKLFSPFTSTPFVSPACLPLHNLHHFPYKVCVLVGFGRKNFYLPASQHLLQGRMNVMAEKTCLRNLAEISSLPISTVAQSIDFKSMLCAGSYPTTSNINSCQGDSGSPFSCLGHDGVWRVQGLASFSYGGILKSCTNTILARVSSASDWIDEIMKINI